MSNQDESVQRQIDVMSQQQAQNSQEFMGPIVQLLQQIKNLLSKVNLVAQVPFPSIAVIGQQSMGKTAVLNCLMGENILPSGSGTVTRTPVIVNMRYMPNLERPYAIIEGCKNDEPIFDFSTIAELISQRTIAICGESEIINISEQPITLNYFSRDVVNLQIIDLPGVVRNPLPKHPENIEQITEQLALRYISNPNTIILAISTGASEIANSYSLALARRVDPEGNRTLGVFTFLDKVDNKGQMVNYLRQENVPLKLKLGYIGLILRGHKELQNVSINEQKVIEQTFAASDPDYSTALDRIGVPILIDTLQKVLVDAIRNRYPEIRQSVAGLIQSTQLRLNTTKEYKVLSTIAQKNSQILSFINRYSVELMRVIEGNFEPIQTNNYVGGSRIRYVFDKWYKNTILATNPFSEINDNMLQIMIANCDGYSQSISFSQLPFQVLIKQQIQRFLKPSLECAYEVYKEILCIALEINIPDLKMYKNLHERVIIQVQKLIEKQLQKVYLRIYEKIQCETDNLDVDTTSFDRTATANFALRPYQNIVQNPLNLPRIGNASIFQAVNFKTFSETLHKLAQSDDDNKDKDMHIDMNGLIQNIVFPLNAQAQGEQVGGQQQQVQAVQYASTVAEINILKNYIDRYYEQIKLIIVREIRQMVKMIMIKAFQRELLSCLIEGVSAADEYDFLLAEDQQMKEIRQDCKVKLIALNESIVKLDQLSQILLH